MLKIDFEILMTALYSNGQLFIPQGQDINDWIDNAYKPAITLNTK